MSNISIVGFSDRFSFSQKQLRFMQESNYKMLGLADNLGDLIISIIDNDPDVVVLDLEEFGGAVSRGKILSAILATYNKQIIVIAQKNCYELRVTHFVNSGYWKVGIIRVLQKISKNRKKLDSASKPKNVKSHITEILLKNRFSPSHLGFNYLSQAIEIMYNARGYVKNLESEIYYKIALAYNTNCKNVERNIRSAIACNSCLISRNIKLGGKIPHPFSNRKIISGFANKVLLDFGQTSLDKVSV